MSSCKRGIVLLAVALAVFARGDSFAQTGDPVRIAIDRDSERLDIVNGNKLPDYTLAQRGSIQFFFGRLDSPDNFFWYFFDGRRRAYIENMVAMRKMQPRGVWIILERFRCHRIQKHSLVCRSLGDAP